MATTTPKYTADNFDYNTYYKDTVGAIPGDGKINNPDNKKKLYQQYLDSGATWTPGTKPPAPGATTIGAGTQIVAGQATNNNQMNIGDYAAQVANDPSKAIKPGMDLSQQTDGQKVDVAAGSMDPNNPALQQGTVGQVGSNGVTAPQNGANVTAQNVANQPKTAQDVTAQNVANQAQPGTKGYDAALTQDQVKNNQMTAAQGTVSDKAQVDAKAGQVDMQGLATGVNPDGSINYTGKALQQFASQNLSTVIDTSTSAGKALADKLGEGNYLDSKATLKGQLDVLQQEFVGPNGEPKIPIWAQGTARNVSKIAAFGGMTGTAATAAMATALMEASIPVAQADSTFYQTLTLKNLDNKQQATLNTAQTLAKFEQSNADNRLTAAIENSKAFLQMDLANLSNEQQARAINNQARIQSILEDAKSQNAARLFEAEQTNSMNTAYSQMNQQNAQFNSGQNLAAQNANAQMAQQYDQMNQQNAQFNSTQNLQAQTYNADKEKFYAELGSQVAQFNSAQTLDADKFNSTMEDSRDKFYKEMSYNIAISNAKWRQEVQLQEDTQAFQAATTDVKNLVDISTNQLNQIWDRSDALLDYVFKASESQKDRNANLAIAKMQIKAGQKNANMTAIGGLVGTFVGSDTGSKLLGDAIGGIFG